MNKTVRIAKEFLVPLIVIVGIILYLVLLLAGQTLLANSIVLSVIILGSYSLVKETITSLLHRQFGLDYIAITAIVVGIITQEYLVSAILALMVSGGRNLESYGVSQAKRSLSALIDRIPTDVTLWKEGRFDQTQKIANVQVGTEIYVRKGEVVGLDGHLVSKNADIDESSLTGEPYFIDKVQGDIIRSGTINIGEPIVIKVSKEEKDSTYKKIIDMVKHAQDEKSPMVRLADKYSTIFTLVTFSIALFTYIYSQFDLTQVLAVLAVATPCPLIIATPIALLGGVNASAKRKIIVKRLFALEMLAKVQAVLFDKTGTITLGVPKISNISVHDRSYTQKHVLSIAEAIERSSLHPLAKAIVTYAIEHNATELRAKDITETLGKGISGVIENKRYTLSKTKDDLGMTIALYEKNKEIATFEFEDEVKPESKRTIKKLLSKGLILEILTGDKKEAAQNVVEKLGIPVQIQAECSPTEKQKVIQEYKKKGTITAMVGDGINDAPALALADVGLSFSNQEQTAASEAADIVLLGGNFSMVLESLQIARRTVGIATQSILWGIGLSVVAMVFASFGLIPPIIGAGLQEAIDVAVILNALRASK